MNTATDTAHPTGPDPADPNPTGPNPAEHPPVAEEDHLGGAVRLAFGVIFLWASGVHVGIVSGDPGLYRDFANGAWMPGVLTAWRDIFMAHPAFWGLVVAVGEFAIGAALLYGGRVGRYGLAGAITFHVALMTFGWGFWIWSVPALILLLGPGRRWTVTDHHILPQHTDSEARS
jgi:hypothetical protein